MATARSKASTTPAPSAVEAIAREVQTAQTRHDHATASAALAVAHAADLDDRLRAGDESVLSTDLLSADSEVRRTAALLDFATEHLAERQGAQAVTVAVAVASELADAERFDLAELTAQTRTEIEGAVSRLRSQIEHRNAGLASAIATAKGAGLLVGEADPLSPVLVVPKSFHSAEALIVHGTRVVALDADAAVASILAGLAA